ncbi:hypothetical protein PC129_g24059 [Phytophthora cactorum]|uniref:Uncharacterized protein n=1 Tax=Phytophthora cactorum TaxID=29920 RepID=A0A8T1F3Z9_9STRA|nr:hypothetical protein Pcac1_g5338 [Phytophthora cactorum]KAG2790292.1 hypothetical protein PC112_g24399 [Phytophthora cactorum]KAG2792130.1 hypothetical protein PC111_g23602 [Phytophthora cactorum]KAG2811822.1 hypothetical protein PC113_g23623 [Phytophthora cactorum]KAG2876181.1 hypothetical protein PC115_g23696 [Phytophthora cactorum]
MTLLTKTPAQESASADSATSVPASAGITTSLPAQASTSTTESTLSADEYHALQYKKRVEDKAAGLFSTAFFPATGPACVLSVPCTVVLSRCLCPVQTRSSCPSSRSRNETQLVFVSSSLILCRYQRSSAVVQMEP